MFVRQCWSRNERLWFSALNLDLWFSLKDAKRSRLPKPVLYFGSRSGAFHFLARSVKSFNLRAAPRWWWGVRTCAFYHRFVFFTSDAWPLTSRRDIISNDIMSNQSARLLSDLWTALLHSLTQLTSSRRRKPNWLKHSHCTDCDTGLFFIYSKIKLNIMCSILIWTIFMCKLKLDDLCLFVCLIWIWIMN